MKAKSFRDLEVWQQSKSLAVKLITELRRVKSKKDYALEDQVRRSIVSVSSNIAEGFDRDSNNELIRFLRIAKGSCSELVSQLEIMKDLIYFESKKNTEYINEAEIISARIAKFIQYLEKNGKQNR